MINSDNIHGWFNFENFYLDMIKRFDNGVFVEIGVWQGKSIVFLGQTIKELNKNIKVYGIDTWLGSNELEHIHMINELGGTEQLWQKARQNIKNSNVENIVTLFRGRSDIVSRIFEKESLDFVFIDGSHTYEDVKSDILCWYPKVKNGGIIAGHDFDWNDVQKAVKELFPVIQNQREVWYYCKN